MCLAAAVISYLICNECKAHLRRNKLIFGTRFTSSALYFGACNESLIYIHFFFRVFSIEK